MHSELFSTVFDRRNMLAECGIRYLLVHSSREVGSHAVLGAHSAVARVVWYWVRGS